MLEAIGLLFFNKSAHLSRGQSHIPVEQVQRLLIDRSASRWGRFERQGQGVAFVNALPIIERVDSWEQSATHRWSLFDLQELQKKTPRYIAAWLAPEPKKYRMPDLEAEAVVELVMHREPVQARSFMYELIKRRPQAKDSFNHTLGRHVSQILLNTSLSFT